MWMNTFLKNLWDGMLTVEFYIVVVISSMVLPDWKDFFDMRYNWTLQPGNLCYRNGRPGIDRQRLKRPLSQELHLKEGRIFITTTKHLKLLDEALTRPGSVDLTVRIEYTTCDDNKEFFEQMYFTNEGNLTEVRRLKEMSINFANQIPTKEVACCCNSKISTTKKRYAR